MTPLFVMLGEGRASTSFSVIEEETKTKRGWSASADHDVRGKAEGTPPTEPASPYPAGGGAQARS